MNVASLELCKELYQASGWEGTDWRWYKTPKLIYKGGSPEHDYSYWKIKPVSYRGRASDYVNAYDAGYLLRKLQQQSVKLNSNGNGEGVWYTLAQQQGSQWVDCSAGYTPEDALVSLCLQLLKRGFLEVVF